MNIVHISPLAGKPLIEYLKSKGYEPQFTQPIATTAEAISLHPDIIMCKLGVYDDSPVFRGDRTALGMTYPNDICFNACCTGRYFIHNLKYTSSELLSLIYGFEMPQRTSHISKYSCNPACFDKDTAAEMILVNVKQGYAKCSIAVVDEHSIITYDDGIAKACLGAGMDVLHIRAGHVLLPGYSVGFIGGCSGRIGDEIVFNGDLSAHPDFHIIKSFIEKRGLRCTWFSDYPLTDIGSIISETIDFFHPPQHLT